MADLELKVKQVRLVENLREQGFQYDTKEIFEPISKSVSDTSEKLIKETKPSRKFFEALDESNVHVKALEVRNKNKLMFDYTCSKTLSTNKQKSLSII